MSEAHLGDLHPVLEVVKRRLETASQPGRRDDKFKVALCIEGGGMRGAISAGMIAAIRYCGLRDVFDVVYGCSAGAVVGAYFIADQVPVYGARIYYDVICAPHRGAPFIDLRAFRHHPYLSAPFSRGRGVAAAPATPGGLATTSAGVKRARTKARVGNKRPVLLLDRLVDDVMRHDMPLDWDAFARRHAVQPLVPVAASLRRGRSHAFTDFVTLDGLLQRVRASARVPGIAGDPVLIGEDVFADALMFEAIPFRSAVAQGATHVVVLRTRPHDAKLPQRAGLYETLVARPCLARTDYLPEWRAAVRYLQAGGHIRTYRRDVDLLRMADDDALGGVQRAGAALLSVLPRPADPKIGQLEGDARRVFHAVRNGFAAGYDALSPMAGPLAAQPPPDARAQENGQEQQPQHTAGDIVARFVFPDEEIEQVERSHHARRARLKTARRRARRMKK